MRLKPPVALAVTVAGLIFFPGDLRADTPLVFQSLDWPLLIGFAACVIVIALAVATAPHRRASDRDEESKWSRP